MTPGMDNDWPAEVKLGTIWQQSMNADFPTFKRPTQAKIAVHKLRLQHFESSKCTYACNLARIFVTIESLVQCHNQDNKWWLGVEKLMLCRS